jgi:hypothetical protein
MANQSPKDRSVKREPQAGGSAPEVSVASAEVRRTRIAEAAYHLSKQRAEAGAPADAVQDWLEAERTVDQQITAVAQSPHQHHESA